MLETNMMSSRERPEFLNLLCKTCGLQRSLPASMIVSCVQNIPSMAEYAGGFGDVHRGEYNGRPVAVKVMRLYTTSNYGLCFSVGVSFHATKKSPLIPSLRDSVEKPSHGSTYVTQMFYRCSARRWTSRNLSLRWCRSGWMMVTSTNSSRTTER